MPLKRAASCSAFWPGHGRDLGLGGLRLLDAALDALLGRFQQAFADFDFTRALFQFLTPRLQPFEDGALRRRYRLRVLLGKHHDAVGLRRFRGRSGRLRRLFLLGLFLLDRAGDVGTASLLAPGKPRLSCAQDRLAGGGDGLGWYSNTYPPSITRPAIFSTTRPKIATSTTGMTRISRNDFMQRCHSPCGVQRMLPLPRRPPWRSTSWALRARPPAKAARQSRSWTAGE